MSPTRSVPAPRGEARSAQNVANSNLIPPLGSPGPMSTAPSVPRKPSPSSKSRWPRMPASAPNASSSMANPQSTNLMPHPPLRRLLLSNASAIEGLDRLRKAPQQFCKTNPNCPCNPNKPNSLHPQKTNPFPPLRTRRRGPPQSRGATHRKRPSRCKLYRQ